MPHGNCALSAVEKKIDAVKRIHRREFLRIGSREILHEADVRTTTAELSSLADAVIQSVLESDMRIFPSERVPRSPRLWQPWGSANSRGRAEFQF